MIWSPSDINALVQNKLSCMFQAVGDNEDDVKDTWDDHEESDEGKPRLCHSTICEVFHTGNKTN